MGTAALAAEPAPELITVGNPWQRAALTAVGPQGELTFRTAADEKITVDGDSLVRWSWPTSSRAANEVLLVDGSTLRLQPAWGTQSAFSAGRPLATVESASLGELQLPRSSVRAVLWGLPPDAAQREARVASLFQAQRASPEQDLVLLDNGDSLAGTIAYVGNLRDNQVDLFDDENKSPIVVNVWNPTGETPLPLARVCGIAIAPETSVPPLAKDGAEKTQFMVGLRDGSLIAAKTLRGDGHRVLLTSAILGEHHVDLKDIVALQGSGPRIAYLSNLDASSHRSQPFLDLEWPYEKDRNVLGGRAMVAGRQYLKAIGMHSAARLAFDLDGTYDRFAAAVAIDDAAEGGGSVNFRVLLANGGQWREAWTSDIVRGGEPPRPVHVELDGAEQLSLVVDYADRGDERDYGDWLDARLEQVEAK